MGIHIEGFALDPATNPESPANLEQTLLATGGAGAAARGSSGSDRLPPRIGRYHVLELLGAGGMGAVYAAYDPELDRKIALKVLHPGARAGSHARERLLREAQALARLSHPNVVAVHDVGTYEEQVFVAMEFIAGMTLSAAIAGQELGSAAVLRLYRAAGEGLAAAHRAGLVHRDFKPETRCPSQAPPYPPFGQILATGGDLGEELCRGMPRHAAGLATAWQRAARFRSKLKQVRGLQV